MQKESSLRFEAALVSRCLEGVIARQTWVGGQIHSDGDACIARLDLETKHIENQPGTVRTLVKSSNSLLFLDERSPLEGARAPDVNSCALWYYLTRLQAEIEY